MASFRIVSTPRGEAPEAVRRAWVGVVLPLSESLSGIKVDYYGVLTGTVQPKRSVVTVPAVIALKALKEKDPQAAYWFWTHLSDVVLMGNFAFGLDEVKILKK